MRTSILVVDDEQAFLDSALRMLRIAGYGAATGVSSPTEVPALIAEQDFDLAFLDITMPELDGLDLLNIIKERSPQTECVMVTANESIPLVVEAMRRGAYDYLVKPITPDQMRGALERALERKRLLQSLLLKSEGAIIGALANPEAFSEIVTANERMLRLLHEAELHAASDIPVLITGDTGVGKELLARAVHAASPRAKGPFVAINMPALSPNLFESELFGHVKGAFTGADRDKKGYLARAEGGTLFLDEIGELAPEMQSKLLRILQEGEFTPVGETRAQKANTRFVAATNQPLAKRVQQGRFRKDLFYRLQFATLHLPPLRDRRDDVPLLARRLLARAGREAVSLSDDAIDTLTAHAWPGNVRELAGVLEAAVNLAEGGEIKTGHLRLPVEPRRQPVPRGYAEMVVEPLAEVERRHILAAYAKLAHNKTQTAKALGIGLQTLHRKLKAYAVK